jgi:lysozyme family protein
MVMSAFTLAFNHAMLYEVGPWFDPTDPDTIAGRTGTPELNRKCGFVDIPGDSGGVTKFGIAQNDNPSVDVPALTLAGAQLVYEQSYWIPSKANEITIPITIFYFDTVVNDGVYRAAKILQGAVGVAQDGIIGPVTLSAVESTDPATVVRNMATARRQFYLDIVQNNPSDSQFLDGWLNRNSSVEEYNLSQIKG